MLSWHLTAAASVWLTANPALPVVGSIFKAGLCLNIWHYMCSAKATKWVLHSSLLATGYTRLHMSILYCRQIREASFKCLFSRPSNLCSHVKNWCSFVWRQHFTCFFPIFCTCLHCLLQSLLPYFHLSVKISTSVLTQLAFAPSFFCSLWQLEESSVLSIYEGQVYLCHKTMRFLARLRKDSEIPGHFGLSELELGLHTENGQRFISLPFKLMWLIQGQGYWAWCWRPREVLVTNLKLVCELV